MKSRKWSERFYPMRLKVLRYICLIFFVKIPLLFLFLSFQTLLVSNDTVFSSKNAFIFLMDSNRQCFAQTTHGARSEQTPSAAFENNKGIVHGELLLHFDKTVSIQKIQKHILPINAKIVKKIPQLNYYLISLPETMSVSNARNMMNENTIIKKAEPNRLIPLQYTPNDEHFPRQWALHNQGQNGGEPDADIDAPEAWNLDTGSRDICIAVVDTGIDYQHRDLTENIWTNIDEIPQNGIDD